MSVLSKVLICLNSQLLSFLKGAKPRGAIAPKNLTTQNILLSFIDFPIGNISIINISFEPSLNFSQIFFLEVPPNFNTYKKILASQL